MMNRDGCFSSTNWCKLLCAAAALVVAASPAHAVLTNKYTFNNNTAQDSGPGAAHATIVDQTAISKFVGGAIDLSANNGAISGQDFSLPATVGAYVDLPNGVFKSAVTSGTPAGAVTLEIWATPQQNRNWARFVDFGRSVGGEDIANGGGGQAYVLMVPQTGLAGTPVAASTHPVTNTEIFLLGGPPLATNVRHHMVFTLDHNDTTADPGGTAKLYINNGTPVVQPIAFILDSIDDINNWLGRAQYAGDPLFDGSIDEFRIYNHALTQTEVTASFNTGPDAAPYPVLKVDRATGAMTLDNETLANLQVKGYSITSAAGGLNPATWTSLNAGSTFDPDGTWTTQSSTSTNLAESVTSGTTDGGALTPTGTPGIGTPWVRTPFEDLQFSFTLGDNSTGFGRVDYIGTPRTRSDLNGDGSINAADWAIFLPNTFTTFPTETTVGGYLKGDLDGDKDNDYADYRLFKTDFILANGASAFEALGAVVPEPSTACLVSMAVVASLLARRRRRGDYRVL